MRFATRVRRRFRPGARQPAKAVPPEVAPKPIPTRAPAFALRRLGEPPVPAGDEAPEAELDTLRGELVRELDRRAEEDSGSGCFRRIA